MVKLVIRVDICDHLMLPLKFDSKKLVLCALLAARSVRRGGF